MAQAQGRTEASKEVALPPLVRTEFSAFGWKRVEALMDIQKKLFDAVQEVNLEWFGRIQSAIKLNTELMAKLTTARTMSETTEACQQCIDKVSKQLVEDSRQFIADGQKIMNLSTKLLTNGAAINGFTI